MIIKADAEGKQAIESVIDLAMKSGACGVKSLPVLLGILQSIEPIVETEEPDGD